MAGNSGATNLSLLKALEILSLFTRECTELRLTEICERLQFPPSTAHRLLRTLEEVDYITQNPENGKYRLGALPFIIGANVVEINRLVEVCLPYVARFSAKYNATTHVGIMQNNHALCIEKIDPPADLANPHTPARGVRAPLHLTAVGKCLLAYTPPRRQLEIMRGLQLTPATNRSITTHNALREELASVQQNGYAVNACESAEGLYCFGVPVLRSDETPHGAISVSINATAYPEYAGDIIKDLRQGAAAIEQILNE